MKTTIIFAAAVSLAGALVLAQAPEPPVVELCGTDVPRSEAELRAVECPEGFVGQWYQERAADSCDWQPAEPQWQACSPDYAPAPTIDPEFDEHSPTGPVDGPGEGPGEGTPADKP